MMNNIIRMNHEDNNNLEFPAVVAARNPNNSIIKFESDDAVALVPKEQTPFFSPVKIKKEGDLILFKPFDYMEDSSESTLSLLDIISSDVELKSDDTVGEKYNSITEDVLNSLVDASEYSPEELIQFLATIMETFPTVPVFDQTTKTWARAPITIDMMVALLETIIFESNLRLETILEEMVNFDVETIDNLFTATTPENVIKKFKSACSFFNEDDDDY